MQVNFGKLRAISNDEADAPSSCAPRSRRIAASQSCTVKQSETPDLLGPSSLTTPPPPAPPTAQFVFSPSAPALSTPVAFDGRSSCPEAGFAGFCVTSDRAITADTWDFGDGHHGIGRCRVPRLPHARVVQRELDGGQRPRSVSTASRSVPVGVGGTPPTAGFVFSPTNPTIGQSVSFNAATSKGGTTGIANYSWDFGDGGKAGGINPTHSFNNAGTYVVLLIVTDEAGQTATATQSVPVQINSQTPLPTADFVFSPIAATTGQSVSFNASAAKAATGHTIVEYSWNFGDGGTGSGVTPSHAFGTAGTYSVVLVVEGRSWSDGHGVEDRAGHVEQSDASADRGFRLLADEPHRRPVGVFQRRAVEGCDRPHDLELRLELRRRWSGGDRRESVSHVQQHWHVQRAC